MSAPLWVVGIIALCLAVISGAISAGDRTVLVQPPGAVVEDFTRKLTTGRYDLALKHLSEKLRENTPAADLGKLADELLHAADQIHGVRGEPVSIDDTRAVAAAEIETSRLGEIVLVWALVWENGQWKLHGKCESEQLASSCGLPGAVSENASP